MMEIKIKCEGFQVDGDVDIDFGQGDLLDVAQDLKTDIGMRLADLGDSTHGQVTLVAGDVEVTA